MLPSLRFSSCISILVVLEAKPITSCTEISYESHNLKSQFHYSPEKSTHSSSNPWLSLAYHRQYEPFHCISYDQRSIMTCLSNPAQYQGNLHGHHTRPYMRLYSSSRGNCHYMQISPTTDDQPSYLLESDIQKLNLTPTVLYN